MEPSDLLIINARIVTMDEDSRELFPGFISVHDGAIASIGLQEQCRIENPKILIDAAGCAVIPGFVNAHTHAIHNLLRGGLSDNRPLYDWLLNVVIPGLSTYTKDDVETAATLFCIEAIRSGITTFVDNVEFTQDRWDMVSDTTIETYKRFGLRAIYARMFYDYEPPDFKTHADSVIATGPSVRHPFESFEATSDAIQSIESLMSRHHGSMGGRIQVWPSPGVAILCSRDGLLKAKDLAKKWNTMLTLHLAESSLDREQAGMTSIEYLASIGFLGPEILAGHCVQVNSDDIRLLQKFDVKVANNAVSNMFLASGIAPVKDMKSMGLTVGIGTDDGNCNGTVSMLSDMKFVALSQKVKYSDAKAITADQVLRRATIDGARAVGLEDKVGSIELGKRADLVIIDLSAPHMRPLHSLSSALVYQALGCEVQTVIVDGEILMRDRELTIMTQEEERSVLERAQSASATIAKTAQLQMSH